MQTLPTILHKGGFELRQVTRNENAAIYEQRKKGDVLAYEVIVIQRAKAGMIHGREYPEREVYPGNEEWGRNAWTCISLERAQKMFGDIKVF